MHGATGIHFQRGRFLSVSFPSLLTPIQVEATKSYAKDNLPTLSSTARAIAFLVAVGTLVVACLQWKNANKLAEDANRLSLLAICEEFPVSIYYYFPNT